MQTNLILSEIEIVNGCQMFEMYKIKGVKRPLSVTPLYRLDKILK